MRPRLCKCVGFGMLLGGVSGSSAADTAALSSVMIPAMEKKRLSTKFFQPHYKLFREP
ncbi:MAG: TRAP transporter large permease subunit [Oscillospiraceae bacterium]